MTLDDLQKSFRTFIRELLALPENSVRKANQANPVGKDPFVTVLFTNVDDTGLDDRKYLETDPPSNDIIEQVNGQRLLNISVQFFMTDAKWAANRLKTLLQSEGATATLQEIGIGIVRAGAVLDLSAVVDTSWEERAQLTIEAHTIAKELITVHTYGTFPITVSTEESSTSSEVHEP
jgi:hypothetical protein